MHATRSLGAVLRTILNHMKGDNRPRDVSNRSESIGNMRIRDVIVLAGLFALIPNLAGAQAAPSEELPVEELYHLDPLVVTATRNAQSLSTAPASISVIGNDELRERPAADLTDALRDLPGISLTAGSQGRRGIQIRGMDASYTLILVDGKRVNSSEAVFRHNDYDIGMLPVESIERIEVVRGGMSALYGSEALGGVINIITKPAGPDWRGSIGTEVQSPTGGSGGLEFRTNGHASGALVPDRLSLAVTGGFNRRDEWHAWSAAPVLDGDGAAVTRPDGSAVHWQDLATLEGRNDYNARAELTWTPGGSQTIGAEYGRSSQRRFGEYYIQGWGIADTDLDRQDVVVTHRSAPRWGSTEARGYGEWVTTSDGLEQTNAVVEGSLNATFGRHDFTVGGEARRVHLVSPTEFTATGAASVQQQAVYAQNQLAFTQAFTLLAGARLDRHENFGLHLTPRGYIVFTPDSRLTIKGGVGTAFRSPTLRQLSPESLTPSCRGACVIAGNPDLAPETSVSYELSANFSGRGWAGSVTGFQNDIDNLIDTPRGTGVPPIGTDPSGLPLYGPVNVNQARVRGIETTLRGEVGRLSMTGNYTFLDAVDLDADQRLDYRPRHNANAQLSWTAGEGSSVFVRGQYLGEQTTGEVVVDPYMLFDAGVTHRLSRRLSVKAGVLNLADTRTDSIEDAYAFVERGRAAYLGLSAGF